MADRADATGIALLVVSAALVVLLLEIAPGSLPSALNSLRFFIVTGPIYVYAAYWAFDIRRALAVRVYRNQLLGVGLIILLVWFANGSITLGNIPLQAYAATSEGVFLLVFVALFYWIDSSVLAFRRSDPLLRSPFHWTQVRIPLWIANIFLWGCTFSLLGYAVATDNVSLMNQAMGTYSNPVLFVIAALSLLVTVVSGIVFLPTIAVRSKWDKRLRSHFLWFGIFVILLPGTFTPGGILIFAPAILLMAFALYKSAKALVPLNRVSQGSVEN